MNNSEKSPSVPPSELPIPFYMVLREELKLLEPDSRLDANPLPGWGADPAQLTDDAWYEVVGRMEQSEPTA